MIRLQQILTPVSISLKPLFVTLVLAATATTTAIASLAQTPLKARLPDRIDLPGDRFFPEGIAVDSQGNFYVGSLTQGSIVRIRSGEAIAQPFISPGSNGLISTIGLLVDETTQTLWACSSDFGVSQFTGSGAVALKAFDLATGNAKGDYPLPGSGFCNDMTLDNQGNLYVTDSQNAYILRLARGATALTVWASDPLFNGELPNLNGIVFDGSNHIFAVTYSTNGLFRIPINPDGSSGRAQPIRLNGRFDHPDGLKAIDANTLVAVEGTGQLVKIEISGETGEIEVLKNELDGPTTAVIYQNNAWVLNSHVNHLIDPTLANIQPGVFSIYRVSLSSSR